MLRPFLATYEIDPFAIQGGSTITRTLEDTDCDDLGATITKTLEDTDNEASSCFMQHGTITESLEDTDNNIVSFLYATSTNSIEDTDCDILLLS